MAARLRTDVIVEAALPIADAFLCSFVPNVFVAKAISNPQVVQCTR